MATITLENIYIPIFIFYKSFINPANIGE